jgi:hypothetical protein
MVEHSMIILIELKYIVSMPFDWTRTIRIIIECSTIYTSSRKQMTKINELIPLHNVQYEKNTDLSGLPIRKKYGFRL